MNPEEQKKPVVVHSGGGADAVYGIGMIGAWVYYLQRATTNQERALGLAKGLVWPAFLVYALLEFLEKE
jgi:phage gp29-like protein